MKNTRLVSFCSILFIFILASCTFSSQPPLEVSGNFTCEGPVCWDVFDDNGWVEGSCDYSFTFTGQVKSTSSPIEHVLLQINIYEENDLLLQKKIPIYLPSNNQPVYFEEFASIYGEATCDAITYNAEFLSPYGEIISYSGEFLTSSK